MTSPAARIPISRFSRPASRARALKLMSNERVTWAVAPPYVWRMNPSRSRRRMSRRIVISEHAQVASQLTHADRRILGHAGQDRVSAVGGARARRLRASRAEIAHKKC